MAETSTPMRKLPRICHAVVLDQEGNRRQPLGWLEGREPGSQQNRQRGPSREQKALDKAEGRNVQGHLFLASCPQATL